MKITAGGQNKLVPNFLLQLLSQCLYSRIVEEILIGRMRSGHNMRNAVRNRGLGHRQRSLYAFRPVVEPGKDMTMHIDHDLRKLPSGPRLTRPAKFPAPASSPQT